MSEKRFLSWVGFKSNDSDPRATSSGRERNIEPSESSSVEELTDRPVSTKVVTRPSGTSTPSSLDSTAIKAPVRPSAGGSAAPSQSTLDRIRELEAQIADLRARRDITALSKEEFEVLATETAMSLIRTAQAREQKAVASTKKAIEDTNRAIDSLMTEAELKARSTLSSAESRGRKLVDASQAQARELLTQAQEAAETLAESRKREAAALAAAAKREAERLVSEATSDVASFKNWLSNAVVEADRLHKIQSQSLNAAEEAIRQTRERLTHAFEKLESLGRAIESSIGVDGRPRSDEKKTESESAIAPKSAKNSSVKKVAARKPAKSSAKKPVAKKPAPANKKAPARKAAPKRK